MNISSGFINKMRLFIKSLENEIDSLKESREKEWAENRALKEQLAKALKDNKRLSNSLVASDAVLKEVMSTLDITETALLKATLPNCSCGVKE